MQTPGIQWIKRNPVKERGGNKEHGRWSACLENNKEVLENARSLRGYMKTIQKKVDWEKKASDLAWTTAISLREAAACVK